MKKHGISILVAVVTAAVASLGAASCSGSTTEATGKNDPGTGGKGAQGTGGAGDVDSGNPGEPALCETYCDAVQDACTGGFAQYASRAACLATCALLPAGEDPADKANTVTCRLQAAKAAKRSAELEVYCPSAGPEGGLDGCGTGCDAFCALVTGACADLWDADTCATQCATLPFSGEFNASIVTGHTLECRIYHATAATLDPALHCPHTTGKGGPCAAPP